jgi:hypothetical protein
MAFAAENNASGMPLGKVLAFLFLLLAIFLISIYPDPGWLAMFVFAGYGLLLARNHRLGFFILPALLPVLDLGIWTGDIKLTEYDIVFVVSLACICWHLNFKNRIAYDYELLFFAILSWFVLATVVGFVAYSDHYSVDDVYQSPFNSIRVGKGFLAAWFGWYIIRQALIEDYDATRKFLGAGVLCGLLLLSLSVLWERHVFSALVYGRSLYGLIAVLLDFSSTYRVTGLFSGMHVGGTALDGYLVCVLPLAFYIATRQKKSLHAGLAIIIFILGLYSIIVTFTRMTIASFALAFVISGAMLVYENRKKTVGHSLPNYDIAYGLIFALVTAALAFAQKQAGYQAMGFGMLAFLAAALAVHKMNSLGNSVWLISGGIFLLCEYGINDSILDSRWHQDVDSSQATAIATGIAAAMSISGICCGFLIRVSGLPLRRMWLPVVIGCGFLMLIIGMGSTRMTERVQGTFTDLQTRSKHWADVIDSAQSSSIWPAVRGFGMGSMPKLYYRSHFDKMSLPTYRWTTLGDRTVLEIGKGGNPFYQKISLVPDTEYKLVVAVNFEAGAGVLGVDICHKHILFSDRWQPDCVKSAFRSKDTGWQVFDWSFNSGNLGRFDGLDWPPTLQFHNYGEGIIAIDSVQITDKQGQLVVRNPEFDRQLQYWFWASDFEHLPWHSKQLWIQIWLEQGWGGVMLFLLLIGFGFRHQWALFKAGEAIPIALLPSVVAMLGLGLTDEYIDEPQTTLMAFSVFFAALQWPNRAVPLKMSR